METPLDVRRIMAYLPHRYPFLLVDRIVSMVRGETIVGLKNVTINEPFFQGHFPAAPVMPGVLIVEAMAQVGGVLAFDRLPLEARGQPIYFMGMDKVRFRRPVVPGDQLIIELKMLNFRTKAVKMAGKASVEGHLVAQAELMAAFGEAP